MELIVYKIGIFMKFGTKLDFHETRSCDNVLCILGRPDAFSRGLIEIIVESYL
jgi:hypothetical protein